MKKVLIAIILILAAYLLIQGVRCHMDLRKAKEKLDYYNKIELDLSYGKIGYLNAGEGEIILSVHGILAVMIKPMRILRVGLEKIA